MNTNVISAKTPLKRWFWGQMSPHVLPVAARIWPDFSPAVVLSPKVPGEAMTMRLPLPLHPHHPAAAAPPLAALPVADNFMKNTIKIGTRGSQLALWQANWVKGQIEAKFPTVQVQIIKIKTTGDKIVDRPLAMVGGKGLFVKEIERALLDKDIDIAVHSMKDMPGDLPQGLCIGAIPVREDPRDVLVSRNNLSLMELPAGATIGTSSLRRASQIKHVRPDLNIASIRGNLGTRLGKLDKGEFDAIVLAAAGIIRLGMKDRITQYLEPDTMLPAVGQGALCIETRDNDTDIAPFLAVLDNPETRITVMAERAFLQKLEGSCHIPVACFGTLEAGELTLTGLVASEDGIQMVKEVSKGSGASAEAIGTSLATTLLDRGAAQILENL